MKFETATYSRKALYECVDLVKKTTWTVSTKKEHFCKCFEIEKIFDFCLQKTNCSLFETTHSCWEGYLKDLSNKSITKKKLDHDLRQCYLFICNELNGILAMMDIGEVNECA